MKKLQDKYKDLKISFTLPVEPDGLDSNAKYLIENAIFNKVRIDYINVMCMDYGNYYLSDPVDKMGDTTIVCLKKVKNYIDQLYLKETKIGCTVMIGQNDVIHEIFTLYDAFKVVKFIVENPYVKYISYWSINRDNGKGYGKKVSSSHSSLKQRLYDFCKVFNFIY